MLFGAEYFVARVAQAGDDVAVFVEVAVEGGGVYGYVGMGFVHQFHAFGGGDEDEGFDVGAAFLF